MRYEDKPVVAFKSVRVGDFGGKTLSTLISSIITFNPDITEAHKISGWYKQNGENFNYQTFSSQGAVSGGDVNRINAYKTLQQVKNENIGSGDKVNIYIYFSYVLIIYIITLYYLK